MSHRYQSNFQPRGAIDKWNIAYHIGKQRMSQSSVIAVLQHELPEPLADRKEGKDLSQNSHQTAATP